MAAAGVGVGGVWSWWWVKNRAGGVALLRTSSNSQSPCQAKHPNMVLGGKQALSRSMRGSAFCGCSSRPIHGVSHDTI